MPQPGRLEVPIKQLRETEAKKTLGICTILAEECKKRLEVPHSKTEMWTNCLSTCKLPDKLACVSHLNRLWVQLRYEIGCNASMVEDLEDDEEKGWPL